MQRLEKMILENVRCFEGRQEFNIRPLTFLIGENSTGKSTAFGCFQTLAHFLSSRFENIDFNQDPYQMGTYAEIARKNDTKDSLVPEFKLGFTFQKGEIAKDAVTLDVTLMERESGSEPVIKKIEWSSGNKKATFVSKKGLPEGDTKNSIKTQKKHVFSGIRRGIKIDLIKKNEVLITFPEDYGLDVFFELRIFGSRISREMEARLSSKESPPESKQQKKEKDNEIREIGEIGEITDLLSETLSHMRIRVENIAPIRSKPQRTYNPVREKETPEGSEMPMILKNLYENNKSEWKSLKSKLILFGEESGLFDDIDIRTFETASDPFQLQISVRKIKTNLMDVGYGISQILPILTRIFKRNSQLFLFQQPEVHLHPRGQAAFTSLLISEINGNKSKQTKKRIRRRHTPHFILETHSDYMIDRARIEISKGNINPEDVSLIYLEPIKNRVKVHNITFDAQANMIGVPKSYRAFFLREINHLIGIED